MKKFYTFLLVIIFISGCGEGLKTLMRIDREQQAQHQDIAEQSRRFKILLERVENNDLKLGLSIQRVINSYGEPILGKEANGQKVLLYREPLDFNPEKRVYLYFDQEDKLVKSELVVKQPEEKLKEEPQEQSQKEPTEQ